MALALARGDVIVNLAQVGHVRVVQLPDCASPAAQLLLHVLDARIAGHHTVIHYMHRLHHTLAQEARATQAHHLLHHVITQTMHLRRRLLPREHASVTHSKGLHCACEDSNEVCAKWCLPHEQRAQQPEVIQQAPIVICPRVAADNFVRLARVILVIGVCSRLALDDAGTQQVCERLCHMRLQHLLAVISNQRTCNVLH
eukprot:4934671-Pleurochrysis_carterae.AAC.1